MHTEKEVVLKKKEASKEVRLQREYALLIKKMAQERRAELRNLRVKNDEKASVCNYF